MLRKWRVNLARDRRSNPAGRAVGYAILCRTGSFQPKSRNLRCGNQMAFESIENTAKNIVGTVQDYSLFAWRGAANLFRPPIYWPDFLIQADIIGVGSASIVLLSGFFTGGVLALQSASTLSQ